MPHGVGVLQRAPVLAGDLRQAGAGPRQARCRQVVQLALQAPQEASHCCLFAPGLTLTELDADSYNLLGFLVSTRYWVFHIYKYREGAGRKRTCVSCRACQALCSAASPPL